jgi:hypothetical protein
MRRAEPHTRPLRLGAGPASEKHSLSRTRPSDRLVQPSANYAYDSGTGICEAVNNMKDLSICAMTSTLEPNMIRCLNRPVSNVGPAVRIGSHRVIGSHSRSVRKCPPDVTVCAAGRSPA